MKYQLVHIRQYDWLVHIYYDTTVEDTWRVAERLYKVGCPLRGIRKSIGNLASGLPNMGLTYSNGGERESVMSLGRTVSAEQFLNTWQHEVIHLNRQMCLSLGIDPFSERAAYLAGDIAQYMYPVLSHYICGCRAERV